MDWTILYILLGVCAVMMVLERMGVPTTLNLDFKGDVKRETRWLAQYGQSVCTAIGAILVWQLDKSHPNAWISLIAATLGASLTAMIIKRLLGRVRPGRDDAGKFLGPTFKHANYRESFPSSHSACAVAFSVVLAVLYPQAAVTFWTLALICAGLRYIMDAHWPSDVFGGIALGYAAAHITLWTIKP